MTSAPSAIDLSGGRFHFLDRGARDAPLLLMLHGFPDHPRTFDALVEHFGAARFRCVAPFLRGYAPSTLDGPYDAGRLAADALELGERLSPERPFYLVGHDWGAITSYAAAARAPGRIAAAAILGAPHPAVFVRNLRRHPGQLRRSWYMLFFATGLAERAVRRRDFSLIDRLWRDWSPGLRPDPAHMRRVKACLDASLPAPLLYYRAAMRPPRIGRIAVPTLYLHGADDGCIAPSLLAGQERRFTGRYVEEVLEGCGHFLHRERPEAVAERILRWFG